MNDAARIAQLESEVQALREEIALLRQSQQATLSSVHPYPVPGAAPVPQTMIVNAATGQPWQFYGQAFANTGCAAPAPQIQTFGVHA